MRNYFQFKLFIYRFHLFPTNDEFSMILWTWIIYSGKQFGQNKHAVRISESAHRNKRSPDQKPKRI